MKFLKCFVFVVAANCFISLPLAYASDAPVEDLSVETPQANIDSSAQVVDSTQPQHQQEQESDVSQQSPNPKTNVPSHAGSNEERLERLEQQIANITNMNLPQQIGELRQEIQQLNGRIQVQQHDIKVLENQQRSFYQDLNRRIQQMSTATTPMTQKQQKPIAAVKPMPVSAALKDSTMYRAAFNLLVKKQYDDALSAFQDYINQYPRGAFVANAYYWMGELYLTRKDTDMATASFSKIVSQYPRSNKVPDAKLKLAIIRIGQGKTEQARQELQLIKRHYPNSTAAQLATIQLQRIEQ